MTFRRAVLFILVFALLLGCAALPAGAEHTHKWVDVDYEVQPTCTKPGSKVQICSCGESRLVDVPALGHEFSQQVYTGYADCTHYGSFYWVCERCGAHSAIGNDKPLGHDWDEGVITKAPQGFTPGEKTYTCRRDPSHTYTEEVEPIEWVFATLENGIEFPDLVNGSTVDLKDIPPLVITKQPEGGYVDPDSDEGLVLTVEAEGGEPPYTYEWYKTAQDEETLEKAKAFMTMMCMLFGKSEEEAKALWADKTMESISELVGNEQEFHVTEGNLGYYCVVTDSVEQHATSDVARTDKTVSIWIEPSNANLMDKDSVVLSCLATNGSGEYTYTWYKVSEDEEDVELGSGDYSAEGVDAGKLNQIEVYECGLYCCVVDDAVTGHSVTSRIATVYAAPELRITMTETTATLDPGTPLTMSAVITGGVPPYTVWWECDSSAIPCDETVEEDRTVTVAESDSEGLYYVYAEDEVGNYTRQSFSRHNTPLEIVKQPEGGTLPGDGSGLTFHIEVANCTLPLKCEFYRDYSYKGYYYVDDYNIDITRFEPGQYYFKITDDDGRYAYTDTVTIEEEDFHVNFYTPEAVIADLTAPPYLYVSVEGGKEPYTFYWFKRAGRFGTCVSNGENVFNNGNRFYVSVPGEYTCDVQDANGNWACSELMTVKYTGLHPIIEVHPQSHTEAERLPGGAFNVSLHCSAVNSFGEHSGLKYIWEVQFPGNSTWYQTTTKGEWFYPVEPGFYRCCVIDTATGKYVYSRVATVAEKLKCVEAEYEGRTKVNGDYSYGLYQFTFTGGVAPYTVDWYYSFDHVESIGNILYDTVIVDDITQLQPLRAVRHCYMPFINYRETPPAYRTSETTWQVVVTDAIGQKCASEKVSWLAPIIQGLSD